MKNKEGISITVLIVTVAVMIILTGVGISFFVKENPIDVTEEQVFLANLNTLQEMLDDAIEAEPEKYKGNVDSLSGMKAMFPDVPDKVLKKYKKEGDKIKINVNNLTEKEKRMYKKYTDKGM